MSIEKLITACITLIILFLIFSISIADMNTKTYQLECIKNWGTMEMLSAPWIWYWEFTCVSE